MSGEDPAGKEGQAGEAAQQLPRCELALIHECFRAERLQPLIHRCRQYSRAAVP